MRNLNSLIPKNVKGGPLGFIPILSVANYRKIEVGGPLAQSKNQSNLVPKKSS